MAENSIQEHELLDVVDCAGYFGFPCDEMRDNAALTFPENRVTTNAAYIAGNFDLHLTWRWIDGSDNAAPLFTNAVGDPDPILVIPNIGSKSYFDLGAGYRFNDNISTRLNISNLFDTNPAFMADAGFSNNTDTGMYDIFGRSYQLTFLLRY